jgi:hypothetical protein
VLVSDTARVRVLRLLLPLLLRPRWRVLLLLLVSLLSLPGRPHGLFFLSLVCAGKVAQRVLQEAFIWLFPLHWPAQERCHPDLLGTLLQLLCICCNQRSQAPRCPGAQPTTGAAAAAERQAC